MKTHLLDSSVPLTEYVTIKAKCGVNVKDAAFVAQSDDGATAESVIASASCFRCRKLSNELTEKYLYLTTDGQNVMEIEEA